MMNLIAVAIASTLACQSVPDETLVGLCESDTTSRDGIGNNIEFRRDGSFVAAVTVLVDLNYQVKDGKLYTAKNKGEPVSFEAGAEISFENNSLVLIGPNGEKEIRSRLSSKIDGSVIGSYKYRHYMGGIAYERFTAEGIMNFRLPMDSSYDCYKLNANEIELDMPDGIEDTIRYSVSGEKLTLVDKDTKSVYNHVTEAARYDSENGNYGSLVNKTPNNRIKNARKEHGLGPRKPRAAL